jgi:hypothetical protein
VDIIIGFKPHISYFITSWFSVNNLYFFRLNLETLTDKDPGTLDLDDEVEGDQAGALSPPWEAGTELPASQPQPTTFEALMKEEDLLIEEYDSE